MSHSSGQLSAEARRKVRAAATVWVVKLHGPQRSPALEAAFRRWLAADEENARQFEQVTEVWDGMRSVAPGGIARLARWPGASLGWGYAALAVLACVLAGWAVYGVSSAPVYRTVLGEQRSLRLADGTRVTLNSATRLALSFTQGERRVNLSHGEAYFEVARDPRRPFVVSAAGHDVTAVGTSFLVRYEQKRMAVVLLEGKVTVSAVAVASPLTLNPGERLLLSAQGQTHLDSPSLDAVTAWRRGEVVLDDTPLEEAVAEMNRYEENRLVLESSAVGRLPVSGIFHTGDSVEFAHTVARLYGLRLTRQDGEIRLGQALSRGP